MWLGLFELNGLEGKVVGILVALVSLLPFYMSLTASCFVFRWFGIHSLSKSELKKYEGVNNAVKTKRKKSDEQSR